MIMTRKTRINEQIACIKPRFPRLINKPSLYSISKHYTIYVNKQTKLNPVRFAYLQLIPDVAPYK